MIYIAFVLSKVCNVLCLFYLEFVVSSVCLSRVCDSIEFLLFLVIYDVLAIDNVETNSPSHFKIIWYNLHKILFWCDMIPSLLFNKVQ